MSRKIRKSVRNKKEEITPRLPQKSRNGPIWKSVKICHNRFLTVKLTKQDFFPKFAPTRPKLNSTIFGNAKPIY